MRVHGYSSAELETFYGVLDRVVSEVAERELQLTVFDMIQRLFQLADQGERDPERLRHAILQDSYDTPEWGDRRKSA
jgi:hypothetical protein